MNVTGLELCKELYKLSGWEDTSFKHECLTDGSYITTLYDGSMEVHKDNLYYPAYDLSYLLRKFKGKGGIELRYGDKGCIATSHIWSVEAAIPEDAVCKLAIVLFLQGVL